jgi:hypothetical protein
MTVRFDDSLEIMVSTIVSTLGIEILESGVIVRDYSGRLAFFSATKMAKTKKEQITKNLQSSLGLYARKDRVFADLSDVGVQPILEEKGALQIEVGKVKVRILDRRIVGADWLRGPTPAAPNPPRFVFASLKGGVGRSTALVVGAAYRALKGDRVLVIDLDFEAPGIGSMLLDEETMPEFGMLDALVESGLGPLDPVFFHDMVGPAAISNWNGKIDVIPAFGRRTIGQPAEVLSKIARAYAERNGPDGSVITFLDQLRILVDTLADPGNYDMVLVDARAGLHETTAAAVLGLGAEVLLFGLDEPQTFQGYPALLSHLARFLQPMGGPAEWLERLTMVQGKAPVDSSMRSKFAENCREMFVRSGLCGPKAPPLIAALGPIENFDEVSWDDEISDEAVLPDDRWQLRKPVAILYDNQYMGFNPLLRGDLLSDQLYKNTFAELLTLLDEATENTP